MLCKVKLCTKCSVERPITDFHRKTRSSDGHHTWCKPCAKVLRAIRYQNNKDKVGMQTTAYHETNAAARSSYLQEYYLEHKDVYQKRAAVWRRCNPEKTQIAMSAYVARKRNAGTVDFTAAQWTQLKAAYGMCAYCHNTNRTLEQEHVVPLVRGGDHTLENIIPACRTCNASKGDKTALEFILYRLETATYRRAA